MTVLELKIQVDRKGFDKMRKRFPAEMAQALNLGLTAGSIEVVKAAKLNLIAAGARKFGLLSASLGFDIDKAAHIARIGPRLEAKSSGSRESPKSYGYFVEYGRAPGRRPPLGAIALWVKRYATGDTSDLERAEFLISKAIGQRGTQPKPFLEPALTRSEAIIRKLIDKEIDAAIERLSR